MTRSRTVRPLVAAWVLVFVLLGTGFTWLSLSAPQAGEEAAPEPDHSEILADAKTDDPSATANEEQTPAITISLPPEDISPTTEEVFPAASDVTAPLSEAIPQNADDAATTGRLALPPAPISGLTIQGANGLLPVLGPDSLVAWKAYARPQDMSGPRPKVALIITGIGLSSKISDLAITKLPGEIDLAFSPYGRDLQDWMDKARAHGHESFLMVPAEPLRYPENDPGPHTLLAGASSRDNLKKLDWVLSQVTGYVGVINEMGSKFTASEEDVVPILEDLNSRGLMLLDSRASRFSVAAKIARRISMPRAINNLYVDNQVNATEIAASLAQLENTARSIGVAVGVARAIPLTMEQVEIWARGLDERGIDLVPVTAIANRQPVR